MPDLQNTLDRISEADAKLTEAINVYYIDAPDDDEPISVERIEINWQFIQGAFWGLVFAGTLWAGICLVFAAARTR